MRGGTAEASRILTLLFPANLLNFFDRHARGRIREDPGRLQLSDTELGLLAREATLG